MNSEFFLVKKIRQAIELGETEWQSKKNEADWYNNNMPNVGQTIDYMSYPPYPESLKFLKNLLNEYEKFKMEVHSEK